MIMINLKKITFVSVLIVLLTLCLSIGVSAYSDEYYSNCTDMYSVQSYEYYINGDDEDRLYRIDLSDMSENMIYNEHIISLVGKGNNLYMLVYEDGNSKLIELNTDSLSKTVLCEFKHLVTNMSVRDNVIYYIDNGSVYTFDLNSHKSKEFLHGDAINFMVITDYNTLKYYTKFADSQNYDEKTYKFDGSDIDANIELMASSYTPRLEAPSTTNPYYTTLNVFHTSGYGMVGNNGNCTCYAYGRSYENLDSKPKLSTANAENWYNYNKNNGFYSYGKTPYLGAVAVWSKGVIGNSSDGAGHVAVVEVINGDTVTTSESGWKSFYFKTYTRSASHSNFSYSSSYSFQGFIYVCGQSVTDTEIPPTNVTISTSGTEFFVGETIALSYTINNATSSYIVLYYDNEDHFIDVTGSSGTVYYTFKKAGKYYIYTKGSNNAGTSDCNGINVYVSVPDSVGDDFYAYIKNTYSGYNVIQNSENNAVIWLREESDNQRWHFLRQSNGSYKIISVFNGLCLEARHSGTTKGTNVRLWEDNGTDAQRWYIRGNQGEYVFNSACSDLVIDVTDAMYSNGTNIQLCDSTGDPAQKYTIEYIKPWGAYITSDKTNITVGESIKFDYILYGADVKGIGIDRNQSRYTSFDVQHDTGSTSYTFNEPGVYCCIIEGYNIGGYTCSHGVWITVNEKTYSVSYNANGGNGAPSAQTKTHGINLTLTNDIPSKNGYDFVGWSENPSDTNATYFQNSIFVGNYNTTLYAVWKPKQYYLDVNGLLDNNSCSNISEYGTFDLYLNGILVGDDINDAYQLCDYGTLYTITDIKNSLGRSHNGSNVELSGTITNTTNIELQFITDQYMIAFDANGGTTSTPNKTVTYDSTYGTLPTPTRDGHSFKGWYTEADGGTEITDSTKVTITSEQTLYAHWQINDYTLTYNLNGGEGDISEVVCNYGTDIVITDAEPEKDGYMFLGWSLDTMSMVGEYRANDIYKLCEDTVLYAVWVPVPKIVAELTKYSSYAMCNVRIDNTDSGCTLIFGKYKGDKLISSELRQYEGNEEIFPVFENVDTVKIFAVDDVQMLKPICKSASLKID